MTSWRVDLLTDGTIRTLHDDTVATLLRRLGPCTVQRLTDVVFEEDDQRWYPYALRRLPLATGTYTPGESLSEGKMSRAEAVAAEVAALTAMEESYGVL